MHGAATGGGSGIRHNQADHAVLKARRMLNSAKEQCVDLCSEWYDELILTPRQPTLSDIFRCLDPYGEFEDESDQIALLTKDFELDEIVCMIRGFLLNCIAEVAPTLLMVYLGECRKIKQAREQAREEDSPTGSPTELDVSPDAWESRVDEVQDVWSRWCVDAWEKLLATASMTEPTKNLFEREMELLKEQVDKFATVNEDHDERQFTLEEISTQIIPNAILLYVLGQLLGQLFQRAAREATEAASRKRERDAETATAEPLSHRPRTT